MTYARKAKPSQIGYKRGRLSSTVAALPVTRDYRNGCERMGWEGSLTGYCNQCGRLPAWCDCPQAERRESN